jgi:phosphoglycerol transferase MdoB-like AlkP superfamily enzyme
LREDSIFVENFFSNGAQTTRGLFATFCSYYPRHGFSAMKTRYTHDYLCLPEVLKNSGYHTEMVISSQRDIDRLHVFFARNGMQQMLDETDFPAGIERMGSGSSIGRPDGALFDLLKVRITELQAAQQPFLLATKTLTTHHPFHVPPGQPEVEALRGMSDGYLPALRYVDLELERFFHRLKEAGLLRNTMVFILGDHGRHEHVGNTSIEKQAGHFLSPLFIWIDDSLRTADNYRPRTVSAVASQVDVTPTILAMNGLMPQFAPFLGRDISCLLVMDCVQDNFAYLISPYGDEVIGLADQQGILLYGLRTKVLTHVDLRLAPTETNDQIGSRYRELQSLYMITNLVLDRNLIWSWKELVVKH